WDTPRRLRRLYTLKESSTSGDWRNNISASLGGLSDRYKNSISEKELPDETYKEDRVALFRVQGSRPENMQAIQFKHVASSLNFFYCYILQNGSFVFTWIGYLTTLEVQELVERQLNVIKVEKLITFAIDPTIGIVKEAADKPRPPSPSRGDWQQVGANDIASEILQDELRSLE
ncbi:villin-4-like protein, partial [Tanacetum coccineum]